MPTFVTLARYTAEGARTIASSRERYEKFKLGVQQAGGRVTAAYGLLGSHDLLIVTELPDERAAMQLLATIASRGSVSTETLVAIPIDELYDLVEKTTRHEIHASRA